ncbi:tail assembly chaperone [Erwinia phage phiEa104]|uniref:Uncharacterized protein n=7 Tax=Caudoviricetes TaxID=2731619 RepID=A0A6B9RNB0_9CAUD|nr:tail assembly chaperone [Erwinia phage phiEa104]AXN57381.1 hypothetical protein SUNLIREN_81 [Erwinia phage SunLIRen]QEG07710.1 hypothetical protein [Salmonella phage SE5]QGF21792.1 hypothetical protein [Salmonella phage ST-3]QHI00604.1 hypothetical protein [Salmonella phage vB_SenM_SB18]CBX44403.1 hypothetical protein P104_00600 [Erwinia phage phiEa104]
MAFVDACDLREFLEVKSSYKEEQAYYEYVRNKGKVQR